MTTGYAERAALYAIETRGLRAPAVLDAHVRPGTVVAEAPSGAGHHLTDYARLGAVAVLFDAEAAMVTAARESLAAAGLHGEAHPYRIGTDPPARRFPVVVCPNGALNQLTASLGLHAALHGLMNLLQPGGVLIAHVLLRHDDGTLDSAPCYDAAGTHDTWLHDWSRPDGHGGTLTRLRRQHRDHDELRIDLRRLHNGADLGCSTVHLSLLTARALEHGPWQLLTATRHCRSMTEIALRKEASA
ncbi:hypothetical protein SAMN05421837_112236 [Amycolatopsis pretoriensis]|uniref:Methyltransferase domain-containing protein n=1 Tax=Amycolatopsis pretoriensis TaxID=218821 RepID=A0A1H5RFG9_9PSEU|nr:class I SAM-dependent methyltransferase [Amycolatopsis pretoriensis]SEF37123.1 hypothetical protein SAMN05421837_112236 [Amycolatopsis pretoriensis]